MISSEAITKAKTIRDAIENKFNTVIYRMIVERIDIENNIQFFFAKSVLEYAVPNKLGYLIYLAIPVVGHNDKSYIVLQKNLQAHRLALSTGLLTEISNHSHPFWITDMLSYNMAYPSPFQHDEIKFQEKDRKLNDEIEGSILHNCFYTAF